MRKLNHPQETNSVPATPELQLQPVSSWMPRNLVHTAVLDPSRWSQRAQQRRRWVFIEARRARMH
jgi:hypothetical protein